VDGRFTVLLDPGEEFSGLLREIRSIRVLVRSETGLGCEDASGFVALSPTQPFTRAPLASRASIADRAITTDTFGGQAPSFYTDAANLSGILNDTRLSSNVPRISANNIFTGTNRFASIGIGTGASPTFPLVITNTQATAYLASTNNPNGSVLVLENNSPNISTTGGLLGAVNFNTSGSTPGQIAYRLDAAGLLNHALQFRVGDVAQAVLTGGGRLGIGTLSPSFNLDVSSASAQGRFVTTVGQAGSGLTLSNFSPAVSASGGVLGTVSFESPSNVEGKITYLWEGVEPTLDAMRFTVGALQWATLTGDGRLGVGTLDPAARLHVRNGLAFASPNPNSLMVMESAFGGYFNILSQDEAETGILFGRSSGGGAEDAGIIFNNPDTPSGLEFRSGGNITRMTIANNGVVSILGTLVAGQTLVQDIGYLNAKTTYTSIPATDFKLSQASSASLATASFAFGEYATITNQNVVGDKLVAAVHLPHGATVSNVSVWVYDNDANVVRNLTANFVQIDQLTRTPAIRATGTTSGASILSQLINCTPVPSLRINNETSFYRVEVLMSSPLGWIPASMGVVGVRIEYQMSAPIP
jgi:hypothetical protein